MSSSKKKKQIRPTPPPQKILMNDNRQRQLIRLLAGIISLVAIVQYVQTIGFNFALDDFSAILENSVTRTGIHGIPTIFKTSYRFGYPIQGDELYRPLPKSIFAIIWSLSPNNPLPGHLLNIVLYAATGFLLFTALGKFLPQNISVAFFSSLLFIAHPLHTEVVANIKSLDEMLAFFFFILSLHFLYDYLTDKKKRWLLISLICYFASLFSKESSITFFALYPLILFFFTKSSTGKILGVSAWFLIPAIIFLLIRSKIVGAVSPPSMADNALLSTKDFLTQKATAIYILGLYLGKLILPLNLTFDYSYNQIPLVKISDWRFLISAVVHVAIFIFAMIQFRNKNLITFGILFYLFTLSLSSNLFMLIGTHMAERLLYVPSFGFCFSIAVLLDKFLEKEKLSIQSLKSFFLSRKTSSVIVTIIGILFTLKTWAQNPVWKNNLTLYESGILRSPNSHRTHYYLGNYLLKKENYSSFSESEQKAIIQRGLAELRTSAKIYPGFSDTYLHIGNYFTGIHQSDSAKFYFLKTLETSPYLATAHNNLGTVYYDQKQVQDAINEFTLAIRYDANYTDAYRNLGSVYGSIGQYQNAVIYFQKSIQLDPNCADCNYYLGLTYGNLGDASNAKIYLDKAAELNPQYKK